MHKVIAQQHEIAQRRGKLELKMMNRREKDRGAKWNYS